jgi:hypothetical protein
MVSISHSETLVAVIVANPEMIEAYKAGAPNNGTPFPDGAKMANIHRVPKKKATWTRVKLHGPRQLIVSARVVSAMDAPNAGRM